MGVFQLNFDTYAEGIRGNLDHTVDHIFNDLKPLGIGALSDVDLYHLKTRHMSDRLKFSFHTHMAAYLIILAASFLIPGTYIDFQPMWYKALYLFLMITSIYFLVRGYFFMKKLASIKDAYKVSFAARSCLEGMAKLDVKDFLKHMLDDSTFDRTSPLLTFVGLSILPLLISLFHLNLF